MDETKKKNVCLSAVVIVAFSVGISTVGAFVYEVDTFGGTAILILSAMSSLAAVLYIMIGCGITRTPKVSSFEEDCESVGIDDDVCL